MTHAIRPSLLGHWKIAACCASLALLSTAAAVVQRAALLLFRAMRRHGIVTVVFTYKAAIRMCDRQAAPAGITSLSSGTAPNHRAGSVLLRLSIPACRHNISFERYGAMPSCQMCSPTAVLPSVLGVLLQCTSWTSFYVSAVSACENLL